MVGYTQKIEPELFRILTAYDTEAVLELPIQLIEVTGIGLPGVDTVTSRAPMQHGDTFLGQYAQPRSFTIGFALRGLWGPTTPSSSWGARQRLFAVANPALGELTFEIVMSNGDVYQLRHVTYEAGFDMGLVTSGSPLLQKVAVRFTAHDPIWHGKAYTQLLDPVTHNFGAVPLWLYVSPVETYGMWPTNPTITLTGPMISPVIHIAVLDIPTVQYISISEIGTVYTLGAGQHIYITTEFGNRQAVDDNGDNVPLTDTTTFSTFYLQPSPIRLRNAEQSEPLWYQNFLRIDALGVSASSRMQIDYEDLWHGI